VKHPSTTCLADSHDISQDIALPSTRLTLVPRTSSKHSTVSQWVVLCVAYAASWLSFQTAAQKRHTRELYRVKFESYDGNVLLFLASSVPQLVLMVPVSLTFLSLRILGRLFR